MKRKKVFRLAAICLLAATLLAGQTALSEGLFLYEIEYDDSMTQDYSKTYYPFPETILYMYDLEDNQVLVMLLDKDDYPSASEYLENAYADLNETCEVLSYSGVYNYTLPSGAPAMMTQAIADEDGVNYKEYNMLTDYDDYLLVIRISAAMSEQRDEQWADEFFETFVSEKLEIKKIAVDSRGIGYVKELTQDERGALILSCELVELVQGADEYDYFVQRTGEAGVYAFAEDARVYLPDAADFSEVRRLSSADEIIQALRECVDVQPDFIVEFALLNGEIIWLDYCDLV